MPDFVGGKGSVAGGGAPLVGAVSVFTDGETISGNGTKADPLTSLGAVQVTAPTLGGSSTISPGEPLLSGTFGGYHVARLIADGSTSGLVVGLAVTAGGDGVDVTYQFEGIMTLTTAEWEAITQGGGGLSPGSAFYVSDLTTGLITSVQPSTPGHQIILLGYAISETQLQLMINFPQTVA